MPELEDSVANLTSQLAGKDATIAEKENSIADLTSKLAESQLAECPDPPSPPPASPPPSTPIYCCMIGGCGPATCEAREYCLDLDLGAEDDPNSWDSKGSCYWYLYTWTAA